MSNFTEALKCIDELVELQAQAALKLSQLRIAVVRKEQEQLYGEPTTPVLSRTMINRLRNEIKEAKLNERNELMFLGYQVTVNYAEYLVWTYTQ